MTDPIAKGPNLACQTLLAGLVLCACGVSGAAELVVRVSGLSPPLGQVGCALFASAKGPAMDNAAACVQWLAADTQDVVTDIGVAK